MIVNLKKKNVLHVSGKRLLPGANQVDSAWWAKARAHPSIKKRIELGLIDEETNPTAKMDPKKAKEIDFGHLGTLKPAAAKTLVDETVDLNLLKGWEAKESRPPVKAAIKAQLDKLAAPPEIRDRTQSRLISTGKEVQTIEVQATPNEADF